MRSTNPLQRLIGKLKPHDPTKDAKPDIKATRIAVCALFLEIARADGTFSDTEQSRILEILKKDYHLSDEETLSLIQATNQALEKSIDLWHFTNRINQAYSNEEKIEIIHLLWKIVYADGTLDKHERYLVHKLSNLLHLSHEELIEAKLKAIQEAEVRNG